MKGFFNYTLLQFKRAGRYLPCVLLVAAVLCVCLALALTAIVRADSEGEDKTRFSIGIVGDPGDVYLNFGLSALKSFDSSRFSLDIVELSEAEAKKSLQSRDIAGYAVIPQGFIEAAMYGDVGRITFVTNNTGADISPSILVGLVFICNEKLLAIASMFRKTSGAVEKSGNDDVISPLKTTDNSLPFSPASIIILFFLLCSGRNARKVNCSISARFKFAILTFAVFLSGSPAFSM
jgi:hypothetical protein